MKYLYSWLKDLSPQLPPRGELYQLLVQLGHDVESIEPVTYPGVVVGEIRQIEPHPNADRLSLVTVYDGTTEHRVVCGAPDLTVGQKAPYASIGTKLPCGLTLKPITIRGTASDGMLCAEDELGLGVNHDTLLPVSPEAQPGEEINEYIEEDYIITLDLTGDRGDVMSHAGLARDIQAALDRTTLMPQFQVPTYSGTTKPNVTIGEVHADARGFSLALSKSPQAAPPSPLYMQSRLNLLGAKSINLATDITNYLLLEFGQPLHAYDAETLGLPTEMGVRRAKNGETFRGLNGKTYTLTPQSLVISSDERAVALAGVLGGEETKVTAKTTSVLFESAHFYPKSIRLMARSLNCLTESALHWERGVDYTLMDTVLQHAQALYASYTDAQSFEPIVYTASQAPEPTPVVLNYQTLNTILGTSIPAETVRSILAGLGCTFTEETESSLTVTPPSWRYDLAIPEDYVEEIVRMLGIHTLDKHPLPATVPQWKRARFWRQEYLKDILVALGAFEVQTYPFMTREEIERYEASEPPVELTQPAIEGRSFMRTSLIPGLLQTSAANPEVPQFILFEIGKIYTASREEACLGIVACGSQAADIDDWWRNLFERLRLPVSSWMSRVKPITDQEKDGYKLRKPFVTVLALPVSEIVSQKTFEHPNVSIPDLDTITYTPVSKFQASRRDIACIVSTDVAPATLRETLLRLDPQIVDAELFDTYTDSKLGENKQSLAFHVYYQAPDHTLTTEELQSLHEKVAHHIQEHYHGTIR